MDKDEEEKVNTKKTGEDTDESEEESNDELDELVSPFLSLTSALVWLECDHGLAKCAI